MAKKAKKRADSPVYAWNFSVIDAEQTLVRRAISNDTIGVLKMVDGQFEFWRNGECRIRTKSWVILFCGIAKIEKAT